MTPTTQRAESILLKTTIGFSAIIALTWMTELIRLPHLLYAEPVEFNWLRVLVRTAVVLAIWIWVHFTTRKLLQRLHHLEEFLLVCSWCRKVGHDGEWLTMEEFFGSKFATETSHGICPECARKQFTGQHTATRVVPAGESRA